MHLIIVSIIFMYTLRTLTTQAYPVHVLSTIPHG
jgi:hypothetical protein